MSLLVMTLLTVDASNMLKTSPNHVLETNGLHIIPAFTAVNPLHIALKFRQTAGILDYTQRRHLLHHCSRTPSFGKFRAVADNSAVADSSVKRRDFIISAFCSLSLVPATVSAAELTATPNVRYNDPALLRALVNVLRARGGLIFLLERLRANQVPWPILKTSCGDSHSHLQYKKH